VELITGIIFVLIFYKYQYSWATLAYFAFACFLIIGTFTDFDHWIIPDSITIGGFVMALLIAAASILAKNSFLVKMSGPFDPPTFAYPVLNALCGAFFGFVLLLAVAIFGTALFRREAMGGGDVKLFAFIGAMMGWLNCILVLAISSFIGAIIGSLLILIQRMKHGAKRREVADMNLTNEGSDAGEGSSSQEVPGEPEIIPEPEESILKRLFHKYDKKRRQSMSYHPIPFGPYIALGSLIVLIWHYEIETLLVRLIMFK
jgi:prepilin signal peptidase PulO-like enzyme (type II secretory pathway)